MELYTNDKTEIWRNNKMVGETVITNGIRQGCTGSPQLFNLIINMIIIEITESRMGYRNKEFYIPVLFYADDGLLISNSTEEASKMIDLLINRGKQYGLEINKEKSNCILFNSTENLNEINDIKHIDKIKYLGVVINNKRQCLNKYKNDKIKLAKHMENTTYSVIHRSSNKLLIGKTFWKSVVLSSILYASAVTLWTKEELDNLQRIENGVWRKILGAPQYSPLVTLQGEIGASTMDLRDMKIKLSFVKHLINKMDRLVTSIFIELFNEKKRRPWIKKIKFYMYQIGVDLDILRNMKNEELKDKINKIGDTRWKEKVDSMSSLSLYKTKMKMQEEDIYDNSFKSVLMYRCRSNTIKLGWRIGLEGGESRCRMCREENEDIVHFIKVCPGLETIRQKHLNISVRSPEEILLLKRDDAIEVVKAMEYIEDCWYERRRLLENVVI